MGDVDPSQTEGHSLAWGHSVLEPTRGHVREIHKGQPVTDEVDGPVVGMAICGALLVDDLDSDLVATGFDKCSVCLDLLDEIRRSRATPPSA